MKSRPGNKYLLAVLLFSFFVTGIPAGNSENIDTSGKDKKFEQTREMRAERKLLWEFRQMEKAQAAVPGTDINLRSKAEMEIRAKIRMLQSGRYFQDPQRLFSPAAEATKTGNSARIEKNSQSSSSLGSISGRVTDASGNGIGNIYISAWCYGYDPPYPTKYDGVTDASGNYTIGDMLPGSFDVWFDNHGQNYVSEYYPEKVKVIQGYTTSNINAQLATGGIVSGKVTDTLGVGIANIAAEFYDLDNHIIESGKTDASGNYIVMGLPSGIVKVLFYHNSLNYASEWYNDKNNFTAADPVEVTSGGTTPNIDAQLAVPGSISGRVTNTSSVGIEDINVYIYDLNHNFIRSEYTDANGDYTISGLYAGNFKVEFYVSHGRGNVLTEWYNDKGGFDTADPVPVIAGSTTANIDAQLATAGSISGRVTNASSAGIKDIQVWVYDLDGKKMYFTYPDFYTDASGNYTLGGLPTGSYKVAFYEFNHIYLSEWYNDKSSSETADPVAVIAGSTTAGIDAQLATGGSIAGRVTNSSGVGIARIEVRADCLEDNSYYPMVFTNANGYYSVAGLATGSYKVGFREFVQTQYVGEWYNDKSSLETADPVAVTAGNITPDINAQLASTGSISGRVTNAAGVGIGNIYIKTYDLDNKPIYTGDTYTDANGNYTTSRLAAGNIKIFFLASAYDHPELISEWYNDKNSFAAADPVTVISGATTPNIDARLDLVPVATGVYSPNGGENWNSGDNHDITWNLPGASANVHIDYSIDNGGSWLPMATATANDGTYAWTVPFTPSTTCLVRVRDAVDNDPSDSSDNVFSISSAAAETISTPSQPTGAASGLKAAFYSFLSGGSTSNLGHAVQYKFDWDNGTDSGWLAEGTTGATHAWTANGTYAVRAITRCVTHPDIESLWSDTRSIVISDSGTLDKYNSPAQQKVLPEVIWAAATGGGTWMSEVQITDISGGSQVSVYYNTAAGRRGPFLLWHNSNGALRSQKYSNLLQIIDGLDSDVFTYYGTVGAVEIVTQDAAHVLQVTARTSNGNYSKTFPALSLHDANTADTSRVMVIPNLTNNNTYRSTCGMFNPFADAVTVELKLLDAANTQIGATITKTINAFGFSSFSPFDEAGHTYPAFSHDNVMLRIEPIAGTGKVVCFGASADNATNDPAAHIAVQNGAGYDNGPNSLQILPEAIWAPATGGGTWVSEVQIMDVTGGSMVSVYSNYGGGSRRGPFLLETGSGAGSKVKYTNILQQLGTIDSSFSYYGWVGALEFQTQDSSHQIQVTTRTLNGNVSKTYPGLNLVDAETANTSRVMLIQNLTNNSTYRSTCGFYNPTADSVAVEFTLLNANNMQIGAPFSRTFIGYDFQAFNPFNEAGVSYPANSYDNVILRVRPTSGSGRVVCFGASANNASNDPAAHLAVQGQ